jgi:hypothetical protein
MKIKYKLSETEYVEAIDLNNKMGYRTLMMFIYICFAATVVIITTDYSDAREIFRNFGALFFAMAFYVLLTNMIAKYQTKKRYAKSETLSSTVILRVTGRGIKVGNNEKSMTWDTFIKYKENSKYFILYTSRSNFKIVPKSAMNEIELKEFNELLEKYVVNKAI